MAGYYYGESNMNKATFNLASTVLIASLLSACGGSSSTTPETQVPTGGTPPPTPVVTTVIGTITGFGSVFVNGVKYEVASGTVVSVEGEADVVGDDSSLAIGMKVKLKSTEDNNIKTAEYIEYDDDLKGIIESISPDITGSITGSITVFGQAVYIDENTAFDDDIGNNDGNPEIDFRDLEVGMTVEISGYPTDSGFLATRVDRELDDNGNDVVLGDPNIDDDELELKGTVEALAQDLSSITVNGIVFTIAESTMLEDGLILEESLIGAYVEITSDLINGDYVARKIEREDLFDDNEQEGEFEIEGVLQAIDTSSDVSTITINGLVIPVNNIALFDGLLGLKIEVEGRFNDNGVLIVSELEQELEPNFKVEDTIISIDSENASFTTRLGLVVSIEDGGRFEDDATDAADNMTTEEFLALLMVGDLVKASAINNSDGSVSWVKIKRLEIAADALGESCEITGEVTEINGNESDFSVTIQGITVDSSNVLNNDFKYEDLIIGRAEFFTTLQVGSIIEAESFEGDNNCTEGMLIAEEMEFEDNEADDD